MINKTEEKRLEITYSIVSITCDVCKEDYYDDLDIQEFLCIDETGGFNSAIGDEVRYQLDVCSKCQRKLFEPYLRIIG